MGHRGIYLLAAPVFLVHLRGELASHGGTPARFLYLFITSVNAGSNVPGHLSRLDALIIRERQAVVAQ